MDLLREQEVLLIGCRRQCLCRNQRGGVIVFLFFCAFVKNHIYIASPLEGVISQNVSNGGAERKLVQDQFSGHLNREVQLESVH